MIREDDVTKSNKQQKEEDYKKPIRSDFQKSEQMESEEAAARTRSFLKELRERESGKEKKNNI